MSNLESLVSQLEACVTNQDVETCKPLLNQVKVAFMTSTAGTRGQATAAQGLECGVLLSLLEGKKEHHSRE